jgi:outer membrane protein assembly factor BamB
MNHPPYRTACLLGILFFLRTVSAAEDWPRFRGPNGSGESPAAVGAATWTDQDYRWRVKLPGTGHSSPVVWGNRLYVTAATEDDGTQYICCLRTADGSAAWKRSYPAKTYRKNSLDSFAAATPTVDRDRVYVAWTTPEQYTLVALDRQSGAEAWRADLGPFVAEHGFGASPIVVGDLVIVADDQDGPSSIVGVECASGKTRWRTARRSQKAAYSTPIVYTPDGGAPQLILTSLAHGFTSLDPKTGQQNWELGVMKHRAVGSPMLAAGLIFAACGEGGGGKQMFAVRPGDPQRKIEAKVVYEVDAKLPYVVTPVAYGRLLFLWSDQGLVTCLDAPSGKTLWREKLKGKFYGSPIRAGERLYCISREGEVFVLAAADQYKLLGQVALGEPSQSTPAVADGVLYLRTLSQVMAVGGK